MSDEHPINLEIRSAIVKKRDHVVHVRLQAPKAVLEAAEILGRFGPFPSLSEYLREELPKLVDQYLARANSALKDAAVAGSNGRTKNRSQPS